MLLTLNLVHMYTWVTANMALHHSWFWPTCASNLWGLDHSTAHFVLFPTISIVLQYFGTHSFTTSALFQLNRIHGIFLILSQNCSIIDCQCVFCLSQMQWQMPPLHVLKSRFWLDQGMTPTIHGVDTLTTKLPSHPI